jgi:hypothetical protein
MKSKKNCPCSGSERKQYWTHLMESKKVHKMSSGAENFEKSITHAQGNNWRRKETKKTAKKKD